MMRKEDVAAAQLPCGVGGRVALLLRLLHSDTVPVLR